MAKLAIPADLLFPPRCAFCDEVTPLGARCANCAESEAAVRIAERARKDFLRAERALGALDFTISSYVYAEPASLVVQRLKFASRRDLALAMARTMAADCAPYLGERSGWLALGVPSYKNRSDHAALLARLVAKELKIDFAARALTKTRATKKQHDLAAAARAENLRGSFGVAEQSSVAGRSILLVDDVMTSGNTLNECAAALKAAGAAHVAGLCFTATAAGFAAPGS